MTPEREAEIRAMHDDDWGDHSLARVELLAALDEVRADAERLRERLRIHGGRPHQSPCSGWEWQDDRALTKGDQ